MSSLSPNVPSTVTPPYSHPRQNLAPKDSSNALLAAVDGPGLRASFAPGAQKPAEKGTANSYN